jgi:hypothetical protein
MNKNSSGVYDINSYNSKSNNATILSTFNVSGLTQKNTATINSSLNVSGSTLLNKILLIIHGMFQVLQFTMLNNDTTINSSLLVMEDIHLVDQVCNSMFQDKVLRSDNHS